MALDGQYEAQRRGVNDEYAAKSVANNFSRTLSQQRGSRDLGDFARGFSRQQPSFTAGFGRRGLAGAGVQSGVFAGALERRLGDYQRDRSRMVQDQSMDQNQYDINQGGLDSMRQRALADIEAAKQRDIALAALNIKQLQPYLGS